ncbi:MAG: flavodoxin family protein [Lachnospiraceae bacterium]
MGKERYSILFSSMTGNTKELADAIPRNTSGRNSRLFCTICKDADPQSEILYIGFWTDKGTADEATTTLLKSLRNKKIFLFGTAGFGGSEEYYQKVLTQRNVKILIRAIR